MEFTLATAKIMAMTHENKIVQGSQGAGKTYSILSIWILKALTSNESQNCTIVSGTISQLRTGAVRDFEKICKTNNIDYISRKNPFSFRIRYWIFEFLSVDAETKALGGRRDRLFLNEAIRIEERTATQLISRTSREFYADFNPAHEFWCHRNYVYTKNCNFIVLTFKDNHLIPEKELKEIMLRAPGGPIHDPYFWDVYGCGKIGVVEGKIFNYRKYTDLPDGKYEEAIGVDYGYEDPFAVVKVYCDNENRKLYFKEMFYSSRAMIDEVGECIVTSDLYNNDPVLCDHSPGQFIDVLVKMGIPQAMQCDKTDGIAGGIMIMKQYQLYVHSESLNMIAELDQYVYRKRRFRGIEVFVDYPEEGQHDHLIDAMRYGCGFVCRKFQKLSKQIPNHR